MCCEIKSGDQMLKLTIKNSKQWIMEKQEKKVAGRSQPFMIPRAFGSHYQG